MDIEAAEAELVDILRDGYRRWAKGASILLQITEAQLLETNFANRRYWFRAVAIRAGSTTTKLWRWLRAGQFYEKMRADHSGYPPLTESPFGLTTIELLSQLHQLSSSKEFTDLVARLERRTITQRGLREILRMHQRVGAFPRESPSDVGDHPRSAGLESVSEAKMIQLLVEAIPCLPLLPDPHRVVTGEFFAVPWLAHQAGLYGALLGFDEAGAATLHLFCRQSSIGKDAVAHRIQLATELKRKCHFVWIVTSTESWDRKRPLRGGSPVGTILLEDSNPRVLNYPHLQAGTDWLYSLLELNRQRLEGAPAWRISAA